LLLWDDQELTFVFANAFVYQGVPAIRAIVPHWVKWITAYIYDTAADKWILAAGVESSSLNTGDTEQPLMVLCIDPRSVAALSQ